MSNNKQSSIDKEFVPYEEALALKELGYDERCHRGWDEDNTIWYHPDNSIVVDNPTFSQAFRWFREKYFVHHEIEYDYDTWDYELYNFKSGSKHIPTGFKTFETYEEAELAGLRKLIEIVKQKQ